MGLRGLRPCVSPRRQAAWGPPVDACGIVVAPMALVASLRPRIPAYQGAQVAAVWVGTSRPASWACRGATAAGNAMAKHGARVARRRDCAAYGCGVHRATADRVQRLRPLLAGRLVGRGAAAGRPGRSGEGLPSRGSGGATPCRGAALGGGRDAGLRVKGAAPCQSRGTLAAFHATPPLWGGGVKYSRSLYFANAYHIC